MMCTLDVTAPSHCEIGLPASLTALVSLLSIRVMREAHRTYSTQHPSPSLQNYRG